jgi:hypothetical protein
MITLSQAHVASGCDAVAIGVFVLVGISTIAAPVLICFAAGKKVQSFLERAKAWLTQNNAAVTVALLSA